MFEVVVLEPLESYAAADFSAQQKSFEAQVFQLLLKMFLGQVERPSRLVDF